MICEQILKKKNPLQEQLIKKLFICYSLKFIYIYKLKIQQHLAERDFLQYFQLSLCKSKLTIRDDKYMTSMKIV